MGKKLENRPGLRGFLRNQDGIMAVVFALLLPVFLVIAALAIDMGYAYWKRNIIQVDASASSLAGAGTLMDDGIYDPVNDVVIFATIDPDGNGVPNDPDSAVIWIQALLYAEKNIPNEDILAAIDLHAGNWEPTNRIFTSAGTWDPVTLNFDSSQPQEFDAIAGTWTNVADPLPLNAVLAETRRADDGPNNNPLPLFLAAAVGMPQVNINTVAIATVGADEPTGFDGCLMAMSPDAEDAFKAFGTADISAYDCDIYVNSTDECALSGNGVPVVEVGDYLNPGMIYVVGDYCATNQGVEYNCNLSAEAIALGETCPDTGADEQIDPFAYTSDPTLMEQSGLGELQDLACGAQYVAGGSPFSDGSSLAEYYGPIIGASFDPDKHSGIGEFFVDGYAQAELFEGVATACVPAGGGSGLLTDDGLGLGGSTCVEAVVYPVDTVFPANPLVGTPIIKGTKFVTEPKGWSWAWDEFVEGTGRQEFTMVPGTYCGGINVRGNGTIVFEDGDYVLKGQAAAGENGGRDEFNLRANTAIEGLNIAFYLADADIEINWGGTADVTLVGRQEAGDPLNGFIFYADPTNLGPHQFRGTPAGGYQGIMYFPESEVVFKGTADSDLAQADGTGICTILITDTVYFNGTTAFNASADGCGGGFEIPPVGAELVMRMVH